MSNFYRKVAVIRDDGTVYESGRMNVVTDSANQYYEISGKPVNVEFDDGGDVKIYFRGGKILSDKGYNIFKTCGEGTLVLKY